MHCTCGPHPRIDLTAVHLADQHNGSENDASLSCREQVRDACRSHGCFHVTIDLSVATTRPSSPNTQSSYLAYLAKPIKQVEQDIESLFTPAFLKDAADHRLEEHHSSTTSENSNAVCNDWESICNGGLISIPFPLASLPIDANENDNVNSAATTATATFRGRTAESGDEQQSTPEPKLSWEFRRCVLANDNNLQKTTITADADSCDGNDENDNTATTTKSRRYDDTTHRHSWSYLPNWTEAMHSVAAMVIHLLGIPSQLVLQEKQCQCSIQNNSGRCQSCCNIDLLRVFRYDSLSPHHDGQMMGSSAHSDWGTLTVVWQDDKGGLQTYCHQCDKWTDVDASSMSTPNGCESSKCSLFVHVGDFLSLASISEGKNNLPLWPSPRHRVVCPIIQQNCSDTASSCRRSLVYFAYPPPGISLDAARRVVAPLASCSSNSTSATDATGIYDCYSLLHDQSHQSSSEKESFIANSDEGVKTKALASFQAHQRIKDVPFDRVIFDKWSQVQRKTT